LVDEPHENFDDVVE
jgi:hypothetical protein